MSSVCYIDETFFEDIHTLQYAYTGDRKCSFDIEISSIEKGTDIESLKSDIEARGGTIVKLGHGNCIAFVQDLLTHKLTICAETFIYKCDDTEYRKSRVPFILHFNSLRFKNSVSLNSESLKYLFSNLNINVLDLNNLDIHGVYDLTRLFLGATIADLRMSKLDTSNIKCMDGMFDRARIERVDLSNFNTSSCISAKQMFKGAHIKNLGLYLKNVNLSNAQSIDGMFEESSITVLDLSNLHIPHRFTNCHLLKDSILGILKLKSSEDLWVLDKFIGEIKVVALDSVDGYIKGCIREKFKIISKDEKAKYIEGIHYLNEAEYNRKTCGGYVIELPDVYDSSTCLICKPLVSRLVGLCNGHVETLEFVGRHEHENISIDEIEKIANRSKLVGAQVINDGTNLVIITGRTVKVIADKFIYNPAANSQQLAFYRLQIDKVVFTNVDLGSNIDKLFSGLCCDTLDIRGLTFENVRSANFLFKICNIQHIKLNEIDMTKIKGTEGMFEIAKLHDIDLSKLIGIKEVVSPSSFKYAKLNGKTIANIGFLSDKP